MSFDTEDILKKVKEVLIANFNTEITALNTCKNDTLLSNINDNAYYLQNLDDEAFSYQNFVVYGLLDNPTLSDATRSANLKSITIFVETCVARDSGTRNENAFYKVLRYTRALERVIHKKSEKIQSGIKWKVSGLTPTSFGIKDGEGEIIQEFITGGITITAAISDPS